MTLSSRGFLEILTGRGLCRTLGLPSGLRVDRGGTLGGDEPLAKSDNGRRVDDGERASILATVMIGEMVNVGIGGGSSGPGLDSVSG